MPFNLAKLADPQYVATSVGSIYANPASTKTLVRSILLHNTHTAGLTVTLHLVPDSGGALGTASTANQIFKRELIANETFELQFGYPLVLTDTNDALMAVTGTASKVVVIPIGDTNV